MRKINSFPVEVFRDEKTGKMRKKPMVKDWLAFDAPFVRGACWGHAVPDGLVIIDIDEHKGANTDQVDAALGVALDWEDAKLQRTVSGGAHYVFALPPGVVVAQGSDLLGVTGFDTRAAGKGFIATGEGYSCQHPFLDVDDALAFEEWPVLPEEAAEALRGNAAALRHVEDEFEALILTQPSADVSNEMLEFYVERLPSKFADSIDTWMRVGMAICHQTQGSEYGWKLFDAFSQRTSRPDSYDVDANRKQWENIKHRVVANPVRVGTLIHMAGGSALWDNYCKYGDVAVLPEAEDLAKKIEAAIALLLCIDKDHTAISKLQVSAVTISIIISSTIWSGNRQRLFVLNPDQALIQFPHHEAWHHIEMNFGAVMNLTLLEEMVNLYAERASSGGDGEDGLSDSKRAKIMKEAFAIAPRVVLGYVKHFCQREMVEWRTDMFASRPMMDLSHPDKVRIVMTHTPFEGPTDYDVSIVDDYKRHFTRLDEFLEFVVMSRFAPDRKKSYLWFLASSDWGKGLLMSTFRSMGMCVEVSTTEIETMLEGRPSGQSPAAFKRAFILFVDEFKSVKSEIKQLQSEISLSPKNQLSSTVEVFAKVFASAESVASLVTENGVEEQFARRMSVFEESGQITDRPLFKAVGSYRYQDALCRYVRGKVNGMVAHMQTLGREASAAKAQLYLDAFIGRYGIGEAFGTFTDSLAHIAEDFTAWVLSNELNGATVIDADGGVWLKSPAKWLDDYLDSECDYSGRMALKRRKNDILALVDAAGVGRPVVRKIGGRSSRAIMLKKVEF